MGTRAMETRLLQLTRHPQPLAPPGKCLRDHARSDAAPSDIPTVDKADYAVQSGRGHRLDWDEIPFRTPGKKD
jgi:hypothetical protein